MAANCRNTRLTHARYFLIKMPFECVKKSTWISFVKLPGPNYPLITKSQNMRQAEKSKIKLKKGREREREK